MTLEEIEDLVDRVPEEAPYLRHLSSYPGLAGQTRQANLISRSMDADLDPAFGWKFVRTFVDLHRSFPYDLEIDVLRDAFYFEHGMTKDRHLTKAIALAAPQHIVARNFVQAMLIIPDLTLEIISKKLGLSVETLNYYDQLFFNVRDRLNEPLYIVNLVYPHGRQTEWQENYITMESLGMIMLRAAFNHGFEKAFAVGGFKSGFLTEFNAQQNTQRFESQVMSNGNFMASIGCLNHRHVAMENAKHVVTSTKLSGQDTKSDESIKGLAAISIDHAVMETLYKLQAPDIQNRIYLPSPEAQAALKEKFKAP